MQRLLHFLGRLLLAAPFLVFGVGHFQNAAQMAVLVPAWLPGGQAWVYVTGAGLLLAGIAIVVRRLDRLATLLLAVLLLSFVVTIHVPGLMRAVAPDDAMGNLLKNMAFAGAFKDTGLAGAALLLASMPRRKG